jgi:NADPH2:quinone reductase
LGARTIAVVSSDEKERVAREAGADEVVRSDGPWKDQAKELSDGGVDVVVDPVGGVLFEAAIGRLKPLGQVVAIGYAGGMWPELQPANIVGRSVGVQGVYLGRLLRHAPDVVAACTRELLELWGAGRIKPLVGAEFALADVEQAHALVESRKSVGKVVLLP